ncbi:ABC transporter substrate-binding protein [Tengunoibacter tsumagoiensis]|uniref:Sugar ABC transporter substrate-binding protein n=1 Tax=Tengunoibacter tsumagoiensis TaxID=2014871 RepID=A0A402A7L5_9CHLR|nr:extracellular solute-binding protein [Tengunoibacter tsumagoiensis]GCE15132.1 hypothetical protein KTT_49910 [Tengunoibacter tsumagoiensis]
MYRMQEALAQTSRRRVLQAAAGIAGTAVFGDLLAACGGSTASTTATINHWDWWVSQAPWLDNEIKLFQAANSSIKIKKTTHSNSYDTLFSLAYKNKTTPDVFMIPQSFKLNEQVAKGWLLPLDKWATSSWRSRFPEGTFYEGNNMINGKLYTAPLTGSASILQLYVNNAVFKQAGLTNSDGSVKIPQTWDDLSNAADAIVKKSNGNVYGFGIGNSSAIFPWWLEVLVRGAGSPGGGAGTFGPLGSMDYRVGKYTYATDRNYADVYNLILDWKNHKYFYPDSMSIGDEAARVLFEQGKFGMTVGGVWNQAEWSQHNFTDYSLVPLVAPSKTLQGYYYHVPGGQFLAISSQTKHPDEAWEWFNWMYSLDTAKRWVQAGEDISVFSQANDPASIKFKPFAQYAATSQVSLVGPNISQRNPKTANVILPAVKPDISDVSTGIYTGQIGDIHAALSDLADRSQQAVDKALAQAQQQGNNVTINDYIFSDWDITKPYTTKPA